jgi:8-oxo-dGTP pyrophosphatase MutT (NUDIX family)
MARKFWGLAASGVLLQRKSDGKVCLFHRHGTMNSGTWGINGGKIDHGEDPKESAIRETQEEACGGGPMPKGKFTGKTFVFKTPLGPDDYIDGDDPNSPDENRYAREGEQFTYTTYHYLVEDDKWKPKLNWEHDDWDWFDLNNLPKNTVTLKDENGKSLKPVSLMLAKLPQPQTKKAATAKESFVDFFWK